MPLARARSSSATDAAPLVELDGGEPLPPKLVSLWRSGKLGVLAAVSPRGFPTPPLLGLP